MLNIRKRMGQEGLTLIELLITIAVIAVVAAISIPVITNVISSSETNAAASMNAQVDSFLEKYTQSGNVEFDGTDTFTAWVDLNGDGTFDSPAEVIETFTVDTTQFTVTVDDNAAPTSAGTSVAAAGAAPAAPASPYHASVTELAGFVDSTGLLAIIEGQQGGVASQNVYSSTTRVEQSGADTLVQNYAGNSLLATVPNKAYDQHAIDFANDLKAVGYRVAFNNGDMYLWSCKDMSDTATAANFWSCPDYSGDSDFADDLNAYVLTMWGGYGSAYATLAE